MHVLVIHATPVVSNLTAYTSYTNMIKLPCDETLSLQLFRFLQVNLLTQHLDLCLTQHF